MHGQRHRRVDRHRQHQHHRQHHHGRGNLTLNSAGNNTISGNINLGATSNFFDLGSGLDTVSGVISGTATTAAVPTPGLTGTYFNIYNSNSGNEVATTTGPNEIAPAATSNPNWLGNQTPAATSTLIGPIDFPNISGNGFTDSLNDPDYYIARNSSDGGNVDNVEARWYGDILIPGTGNTPVVVNFATSSDDGSDLYIDGNLVVNNNFYQGNTRRTGLATLTPGLHTIDIEYYQGGGGASMDAQWDPTGGTNFVDIPNTAFFIYTPVNTVTKNGTGTLTLSNTNTYIGLTSVSAGTLIATANGAMGPATAAGIVVSERRQRGLQRRRQLHHGRTSHHQRHRRERQGRHPEWHRLQHL